MSPKRNSGFLGLNNMLNCYWINVYLSTYEIQRLLDKDPEKKRGLGLTRKHFQEAVT